jgi:hypothetical protein
MKRVVLKRVIWSFLNTKYPDAYVKKTVFGNLCCINDDNHCDTFKLTNELSVWFNIDKTVAKIYLDSWFLTLPVVVSVRNSTNPAVLVTDTVIVNSTL